MQAAVNFLKVIGDAFAVGKIAQKEIYALRDAEAKNVGISLRTRKSLKKPAAASDVADIERAAAILPAPSLMETEEEADKELRKPMRRLMTMNGPAEKQ